MFPKRYFPKKYFAPRYFPPIVDVVVSTWRDTVRFTLFIKQKVKQIVER